ncbi:MAG: DNA topology modulation protein [Acidobacteriota bacterium]|nr:DNA topology modulation protein [Acidobacteriota bacterium]
MKKILVIGSGGAGKSTFSARLGRLLNIEVIHLDAFHWKPGWVKTPKPEWREKVAELVKRETWIIDGNYTGTFEIRFAACDAVIFLDVARSVCLWRVLKRLLIYRSRGRPDMAAGCREQFDLKFMAWVWGYPIRTRPKVLQLLQDDSQSKQIVHLRNQSEIDGFLCQ